ncbi:hypothetical protein DRW03_15655 [Corallococcus sp. H22C18031201]|nr:hypothetical protein DRW03_15655 [Corallococcus sp. H22C18031201]
MLGFARSVARGQKACGCVVAVAALSACGSSEIRAREGSDWTDYRDVSAFWESNAPGEFSACGSLHPDLRAVDGDSSVCLHVRLDRDWLTAVKSPAVLNLDGRATVRPALPSAPEVSWEAGDTHSSAVVAAWVSQRCFADVWSTPVVQQLQGTLRLHAVQDGRLAGSLVLDMTGAPAGVRLCGGVIDRVRGDVDFSLPR